MRIRSFITFSTVGLAFVACRGSSSNKPDSNGGGDGNGSNGAVTIQQVQNDQMAPGTPVSLSGVVVTAIDNFGGKTGDIWVEEPEGGPFSGIHIFKADPTAVAGLAVGDVVNVSGAVKDEFALSGSNADPTGRTETELKPAAMGGTVTVTKTGTGTVPAAVDVNALMIGQLPDADMQGSAFSAAWEPYEGVLIKVSNVTAMSKAKAFGSTMPTPPDNYSFGITGVAKVEGSLADITMSGVVRNTCLASVTGVVSYFYDYLVLPTSTADLATGGTACPALETMCSDSVDNDGNGFNDCGDNNCILTATSTGGNAACLNTMATISSIDSPATPPTGGQEIGVAETVCVTQVAFNGKDFWVAKGPGASAANEGLYVFSGGQTAPTGLAIGKKVDVIGTVSDFTRGTSKALREFNELQGTVNTGACAVTPSIQTSATLTGANGRQWIGSYVTINNVAVVDAGTSANHGVGHLKSGGITFESLPDIIGTTGLPATEVGKCYSAITGIWSYDVYSDSFGFEPTGPGTGTGTCI